MNCDEYLGTVLLHDRGRSLNALEPRGSPICIAAVAEPRSPCPISRSILIQTSQMMVVALWVCVCRLQPIPEMTPIETVTNFNSVGKL